MSVTINICTRKRPGLLLETIEHIVPLLACDDTTLLVSADRDDTDTLAVLDTLPADKRVLPIVMDREDSLGEKMNRALVYAPADLYVFATDYSRPMTRGFDLRLSEAARFHEDGIGLVYSCWASLTFPVVMGVTAKLADKMGFIFPPYFPFWFVDHWVDDIAQYIGRVAWADIEFDNSRRQETTGRADVIFWSTLFDALYLTRQEQAKKIIESPDFHEPPLKRAQLLAAFNAVHARSRAVNAETRRAAGGAAAVSMTDDERARYARIRSKAAMMMRDLLPEIERSEAR